MVKHHQIRYLAPLLLLFAAIPSRAGGSSSCEPLKIAALGTSLTSQGAWITALERDLSQHSHSMVRIANMGRAGGTSDWGISQLPKLVEFRPSIVLIELYANDAAINKFITVEESRDNISLLLRELRNKLPETKVFLLEMNPIDGLRRYARPLLNSYIEAHRLEAGINGAGYISLRLAWDRLSKDELRSAIPDGLHPTPSAASNIIAPEIANALKALLCINAL